MATSIGTCTIRVLCLRPHLLLCSALACFKPGPHRNELHQLLKAALSENMLDLTDEQIATLVDDTFAQVDSNGSTNTQ